MSTPKFVMAFPLPNFKMAKDEVRLEKEVKIRKLGSQEIDFLKGNEAYKHRAQALKVSYENALEIGSSAPFPDGAIDIFFKRKSVLTTLRLFKEGHLFIDISIPHIRYDILKEDVRDAFDSFFISMSPFQPELYSIEKPDYALKIDEIDRLTNFHNILRSIKLPSDLNVAVIWFNQALETANNLECLIKHIVALEAMYLKGGPELTYRLSNRVSSFVGRSPHERLSIKHWIREFYKMRSTIIHGGKRTYIIPSEYLSKLEGYVRVSIKKMIALRQKYKKDTLLKLIENSIFDDEPRAKLEKEAVESYGFSLY